MLLVNTLTLAGYFVGFTTFQILTFNQILSFPPTNVNFFQQMQGFADINYGLTDKEGFCLILIDFNIYFASFKGGKAYKSVKMKTSPQIAIKPVIKYTHQRGTVMLATTKIFMEVLNGL